MAEMLERLPSAGAAVLPAMAQADGASALSRIDPDISDLTHGPGFRVMTTTDHHDARGQEETMRSLRASVSSRTRERKDANARVAIPSVRTPAGKRPRRGGPGRGGGRGGRYGE
jgi:hypothetical protein